MKELIPQSMVSCSAMFQMQSSRGVTFTEKMLLKISPNCNYIKKTLRHSCFPVNFEGKVRTTASDVFNIMFISFSVYENLKPNDSKVLKADFCVYLVIYLFQSQVLIIFGKNTHLQKFYSFVMNRISQSIVNILTTWFFEKEERLNGKI